MSYYDQCHVYLNWLLRIDICYWCMGSYTRKVINIKNRKHLKKKVAFQTTMLKI